MCFTGLRRRGGNCAGRGDPDPGSPQQVPVEEFVSTTLKPAYFDLSGKYGIVEAAAAAVKLFSAATVKTIAAATGKIVAAATSEIF